MFNEYMYILNTRKYS